MAGLIDVGIIKPELANSFAAGYRGAEQSRNLLAQQKQDTEMGQMKLEQLKNDRTALLQLQDSLRSAGKDPDPVKVFDALIATGNPDYVMKGMDGKRRLTELQRADSVLRQFAPELFQTEQSSGAAPAAVPAAPAPGSFAADVAQRRATMTPPAAPAPVNAMAPAAAPTAGADVNALRRQLTLLSSIDDPRAKALADVVKGQIQEAAKSYVVGGRLVTGAGKELYAAPDKATDLQRNYEYAKTPAGGNFKGSLADFKVLATPKTTTTITNVQEKAEKGEFGKFLVQDVYKPVSQAAALATKSLPAIEANLGALNAGLSTGFGTDAKKAGARVLGALGVKDAEKFAENAEVFQANAINAVLQKQLEQKGPQTESDARRIEQVGAELAKTKGANEFILSLAKEQLKRDVEQRNFYDNYRRRTGSFDGAEDAWFSSEGGKSLFDRPGLKKFAPGVAAQSAAAQIPGSRPAPVPAAAPIYARNPQTNQRIMSTDGGNTWTPAR